MIASLLATLLALSAWAGDTYRLPTEAGAPQWCSSMPEVKMHPLLRPSSPHYDCFLNSDNLRAKTCHFDSLDEQLNKDWAGQGIPKVVNYQMIVPTSIEWQKKEPQTTKLNLINAQYDPVTKRIVRFTVESRAPGSPAKKEDIKEYWDPRTDFGKKREPNGTGEDFDKMLAAYLGQAHAEGCDWAASHYKQVAYARDAALKRVEDFTEKCDNVTYPCCDQGDAAWRKHFCPKGYLRQDSPNAYWISVIAAGLGNKNFNQELIDVIRSGMIDAQAALVESTSGSDLDSLTLGPSDADSKDKCGATHNESLRKKIADHRTVIDNRAVDGFRAVKELEDTTALARALMEYGFRQCRLDSRLGSTYVDNPHPDGPRGISDYALARRELNEALNKKHALAILGETDAPAFYEKVKKDLAAAGVTAGIDFSKIDGESCRSLKGDDQAEWRKLDRALAAWQPDTSAKSYQDLQKSIREAKKKAFLKIREKIDDFTRKCEDAIKPYDDGWFYSSGLDLWGDSYLINAVVRRLVADGGRENDIARFQYIYCANKKEYLTTETHKAYFMVGAGIVMLAIPGLEGAGLVTESTAGAILAGDIILSATMAAGDVGKAYYRKQDVEGAVFAGLEDYGKLDQANQKFYSTLAVSSIAVGTIAAAQAYRVIGKMVSRFVAGGDAALKLSATELRTEQKILAEIEDSLTKTGKVSDELLVKFKTTRAGKDPEAVKFLEVINAKAAPTAKPIETADVSKHMFDKGTISSRKKGITAGHGSDQFEAALKGQGEVITSTDVPGLDGVKKIEYKLYKGTSGGAPTTELAGGDPFVKTVFDRAKWKPEDVEKLAKELFGHITTNGTHEATKNGVTYIGWVRDGKLQSFGIK